MVIAALRVLGELKRQLISSLDRPYSYDAWDDMREHLLKFLSAIVRQMPENTCGVPPVEKKPGTFVGILQLTQPIGNYRVSPKLTKRVEYRKQSGRTAVNRKAQSSRVMRSGRPRPEKVIARVYDAPTTYDKLVDYVVVLPRAGNLLSNTVCPTCFRIRAEGIHSAEAISELKGNLNFHVAWPPPRSSVPNGSQSPSTFKSCVETEIKSVRDEPEEIDDAALPGCVRPHKRG